MHDERQRGRGGGRCLPGLAESSIVAAIVFTLAILLPLYLVAKRRDGPTREEGVGSRE